MRLALMVVACVFGLAASQQRDEVPVPAAVDLSQLVAAASRWVDRFDRNLSGLLFREQYLQRVDRTGSRGTRQLLLEANVFLLEAPPARHFLVYRDVYRIGARAILDHTDRLQKLLAEGTASAFERAKALTDASARHNLGRVTRNINVPTMVFDYLAASRVQSVRVRQAGRARIEGLDTTIVEFEEIARPTLVRGLNDEDVPARGRFWIHSGSGAVLRALVEFEAPRTQGRMEVRLRLHSGLGVWVPQEMTDVWTSRGERITGLARYDNFKRVTVATTEIVK